MEDIEIHVLRSVALQYLLEISSKFSEKVDPSILTSIKFFETAVKMILKIQK